VTQAQNPVRDPAIYVRKLLMQTTRAEWLCSVLDAAQTDIGLGPDWIGSELEMFSSAWLFFEHVSDAARFVVYLDVMGIEHRYRVGTRTIPLMVPDPDVRSLVRPSSRPPSGINQRQTSRPPRRE